MENAWEEAKVTRGESGSIQRGQACTRLAHTLLGPSIVPTQSRCSENISRMELIAHNFLEIGLGGNN